MYSFIVVERDTYGVCFFFSIFFILLHSATTLRLLAFLVKFFSRATVQCGRIEEATNEPAVCGEELKSIRKLVRGSAGENVINHARVVYRLTESWACRLHRWGVFLPWVFDILQVEVFGGSLEALRES